MVFGLDELAFTFDFLGKVLLGVSVLLVHMRIRKEHRIDKRVLKEIRKERGVTILGIILIVLGYIVHLIRLV